MPASVVLYKINDKITPENNIMLNFGTFENRRNFFNDLVQERLPNQLSPTWQSNIWDLETSIVVYLEKRLALTEYNYMSINNFDFTHYYFIMGYNELGANQVRYFLKKDVLMTYASYDRGGVDLNNSTGLILREHKDRFSNNTGKPIYDKEIEDINTIPAKVDKVVDYKKTIGSDQRMRLALTKLGGGIKDNKIMSKEKYVWEVYTEEDPKTIANPFVLDTYIDLGWAFNNNGPVTLKVNDGLKSSITLKKLDSNSYIWVLNKYINSQNNEVIRINLLDLTTREIIKTNILSWVDSVSNPSYFLTTNNGIEYHYVLSDLDPASLKMNINTTDKIVIYSDFGIMEEDIDYQHISPPVYNSWEQYNSKTYDMLNYNNNLLEKVIEMPYEMYGLVRNGGNKSSIYIDMLTDFPMFLSDSFKYNENDFIKNFIYNGIREDRIPGNDPKLFTSQFNPIFMTWYNESVLIKRENMKSDNLEFKVKVDSYDHKRLIFDLLNKNDYELNNYYEMLRNIDMNNDLGLIKSDFNKYIEYTYANDLKLNALQESQATRNLQKQEVNLLTRVGIGAASGALLGGGVGSGVTAAVGAAGALITGLIDINYSKKQHQDNKINREIEYNNKLIGLQNTMLNVAGTTSDLNHLSNTDKIKFYSLTMNDNDFKYVDDYLFKYGYQSLRYGNLNIQTRKYFDYKKVIIDNLKTSVNLTDQVKQVLLEKFANGVTIYHYYAWVPFINFDQNFENYELSLEG